jgi:Mn-containing catalase
VKTEHLVDVLGRFHREKLTARQRHAAVARLVSDYDANNTYQYVIAREDVHLSWLEAALAELGAAPAQVDEPALQPLGKKESFIPLVSEDARSAQAWVEQWRPRLGEVTHARHRGMMQVVLGETLEHKRFFDQIAAGREDVLGRRANGPGSPGTGDGVMAVRWIG